MCTRFPWRLRRHGSTDVRALAVTGRAVVVADLWRTCTLVFYNYVIQYIIILYYIIPVRRRNQAPARGGRGVRWWSTVSECSRPGTRAGPAAPAGVKDSCTVLRDPQENGQAKCHSLGRCFFFLSSRTPTVKSSKTEKQRERRKRPFRGAEDQQHQFPRTDGTVHTAVLWPSKSQEVMERFLWAFGARNFARSDGSPKSTTKPRHN